MNIVRNATINDIEARRKAQFISTVPCVLCGSPTITKDIRRSDKALCNKHEGDRAALQRHNYFHGQVKTAEEKLKVVKSDPTVSRPTGANFWNPKSPHQFERNHPDYGKVIK